MENFENKTQLYEYYVAGGRVATQDYVNTARQQLKDQYNIEEKDLIPDEKQAYHVYQAMKKNRWKAGINVNSIQDADKYIKYLYAAAALGHNAYVGKAWYQSPYDRPKINDNHISDRAIDWISALGSVANIQSLIASAEEKQKAKDQKKAERAQRAETQKQQDIASGKIKTPGNFSITSDGYFGDRSVFDKAIADGNDVKIVSTETYSHLPTGRNVRKVEITYNEGKPDEFKQVALFKPDTNSPEFVKPEGINGWIPIDNFKRWIPKKLEQLRAAAASAAEDEESEVEEESLKEEKIINTKINIRESLNKIDLRTDNRYDLRNLYDACVMDNTEKRALAEMLSKNTSASSLYEALMNKFEGKPLVEAWVPAQYGFSQKKIPVHEFIELLEDHTQGKIEGDKNCRYIAVTMDSSVSHHGYEGVLFTDSLDEAKRFADEENHSKLADGPWEYSLPYRVFTVVYDTIDIYPEVIYPNVELNGSGFPNKKEDYKKYTYRFYKLSNEESKELVDKYAKGELKTDDEILEWLRNHGVSGRTAEENLYDLKKIFKNESTNESLKESKASPYQNISDKDVRNLEKELKKAKDSKRKSFLQATLNKYKKELKSSGKLHESYNKPIEESGYLDYSETGNPSWHDDYDYDEDSGYSPDLPEKYTLVGVDGNAYAIMGYTANALKREGLRDLVDQMYKEATSGDYDNLLVVCMKYVDMANEAAYNKDESLNESDEDSLDKYYKVSYSFDTGNAESGPVVGNDFDIIKAKSEEDACRKFEASCSDEGHCGCTAVEATPEQVAEYESKFGPIEESLNEGVHADDELTRQLVELLKTILAGDNLASIGAMEDLLDFMEDLPVGTIIDLPQQYVIQQIRKQGDDSYSYQFDGMGEVYKSRKIDRADAQEMILEWAERSGPETLRIMSESLNEAADREVDRKGFVSLIKYGVFDPGGNYAVLRDGNFVYKFWADDDEEAKEMFRNNLKESLYESESEKDFWSELDEIAGEYLSGKISEDTFGDKYEKLANMYLSKGGEEAKRLAWQIAGANSADTYLNMDDPTAEDFDRCMESANTEAKILDKYGFSNYAEMIRRDMREAEEEQEKEQEDSEY